MKVTSPRMTQNSATGGLLSKMATTEALISPTAKGKKASKCKLAGSYDQKKLQAVIGFCVLAAQSEGGGSTLASREAGMVAAFLGRNGQLNQVLECLAGRGVFSSLWEDPAGNGKKMLVSTLSGGSSSKVVWLSRKHHSVK